MKNSFDLSTLQIQWHPLTGGASFFKTHKLLNKSLERIELHPTLIWQIMYFFIFFIGLSGVIIIPSLNHYNQEDFFHIVISFLMMIIALGLLYFRNEYIIFDRKEQAVWRVKKYSLNKIKHEKIPFENIVALQFIQKFSVGMATFYSWELNFILKSTKRIYITDYASYNGLRKDAIELSKFLKIPLLEEDSSNKQSKMIESKKTVKQPKNLIEPWKCKSCAEMIESQFDICWNCKTPKDADNKTQEPI